MSDTPEQADNAEIEKDFSNYPEIPEQSPEDVQLAHKVEEALYDVVDPELGINVVDLGLVYDVFITDGDVANLNMTLTSPACPLTDVIHSQAADAVVGSGIASELKLEWVWMPPWGPDKITEDGREQLRALGFNI